MKKMLFLVFAVAIASANLSAQDKQKPVNTTPEERTEKVMIRMKERLALSEAQQAKLKPVILKKEQQRDEFRLKREALSEANRKTMKTIEEEIKLVLDADQQKKLESDREIHHKERGQMDKPGNK